MKNTKILITGSDKKTRTVLADTIANGCKAQGICTGITDLKRNDAIISVSIPTNIETAIFVGHHDEKKFAGIYARLVNSSPDNLKFVHIDLK